MDDLQRTSEIVVFMVYVEKWSGGFNGGTARGGPRSGSGFGDDLACARLLLL